MTWRIAATLSGAASGAVALFRIVDDAVAAQRRARVGTIAGDVALESRQTTTVAAAVGHAIALLERRIAQAVATARRARAVDNGREDRVAQFTGRARIVGAHAVDFTLARFSWVCNE